MGQTPTVDDGMAVVYDRVAGIDIGKKELAACVRTPVGGGRFASRTRTFSTVTAGLLELAAWLEAEQVQAVAMEATATY
ncbi:hypothetical protein RM446_24780, partial [Streptomonospora sp. DSM 45055]|nr:hypothetical protein [Streptomonospora sp. DSM 45055]